MAILRPIPIDSANSQGQGALMREAILTAGLQAIRRKYAVVACASAS